MSSKIIRVVQYGLGPVGSAAARHIMERDGIELVGGVDIDQAKTGRDVGEVIGLGDPVGFSVENNLSRVLEKTEADVVVHTTGSFFDLFESQIIEILEAGLDIVSTSEELSFPWLAHPDAAARIDTAARQAGRTVLGTGVNPGFLMDSLSLNLTAICQRVDRIDVTRLMNASLRRGPFQAKIGSGMTIEGFNAKMETGLMGHIGLPESMGMVFNTLGKKLVKYESSVEPVVADLPVKTDFFEIQPGQVRGLKQVARGYTAKGEFMTLTFIAALDEKEDGDTILISGIPDLEVRLKGTNGDIATVAIVVNAVRSVFQALPGLVTMRDLPIVTNW
ncbi:MAG: dihydrodipicolinate reductase [Thermodesulfobacteriota bacterium]|nr:dihydrodipicolinate reductase [Thermodesulfobacteriota bacterium]